jgi:hypothetical protein
MQVSSKLHAPAALTLGKNPDTQWTGGRGVDVSDKPKNILHLPGFFFRSIVLCLYFEPGPSSPQRSQYTNYATPAPIICTTDTHKHYTKGKFVPVLNYEPCHEKITLNGGTTATILKSGTRWRVGGPHSRPERSGEEKVLCRKSRLVIMLSNSVFNTWTTQDVLEK